MKCIALVSLSLVSLAACDAPTAPTPPTMKTAMAAAVMPPESRVVVNEKFVVGGTLDYTCGPAGTEEMVPWTGIMHTTVRLEETENGGFHQVQYFNLVGAEGVGLISGDRYIFQAIEFRDVAMTFDPLTRTVKIDSFSQLIKVGSDDNAWVRNSFVLSFPPFVSETIRSEVECRG